MNTQPRARAKVSPNIGTQGDGHSVKVFGKTTKIYILIKYWQIVTK